MDIKTLRNTDNNLNSLINLSNNLLSKETHIIIFNKKIIFIEHEMWEPCQYCNLEYNDENITIIE